jgi:hypothetical protein
MTGLPLLALLVITAAMVWDWSRRHRITRQSPEKPSVIDEQLSARDVKVEDSCEKVEGAGSETEAQPMTRETSAPDAILISPTESQEQVPPARELEQTITSESLPDTSLPTTVHSFTPTDAKINDGFPAGAEPSFHEQMPAAASLESEAKQSDVVPAAQKEEATSQTNTPLATPETGHEECGAEKVQETPSVETIPSAVAAEAEETTSQPAEETKSEIVPQSKPRDYRPLVPISPTARSRLNRTSADRQQRDISLELKLQIDFGRDGAVKMLALVPERREGMPSQIEIDGSRLNEWRDSYYDALPVENVGDCLRQNVEWRGRGGSESWRWILTRRELHVLVSGDVCGLYQFGSVPRLLLDANHTLLTAISLRRDVEAALVAAGCSNFTELDETTAGVPSGWLLFRDVKPTRAVLSDRVHILNALCPLPEIKPHYVGGIRLKRQTWLAGFAPRIRFTGELGDDFRVTIDGQPAQRAADGAFEAPGWDAACEHLLWFAGKTDTYELQTMEENWERWHAHGFGTGAAICGASTHCMDGACWRRVCVPAANPWLIGVRPGEIFLCRVGNDVNTEIILALVPFTPVWALPEDQRPQKSRSARVVLLEFIEPINKLEQSPRKRNKNSALRRWAFAIRNARRKQLALSVESEAIKTLWRRYGVVATQLRRQLW